MRCERIAKAQRPRVVQVISELLLAWASAPARVLLEAREASETLLERVSARA